MKKKIFAIAMALVMTTAIFTGCKKEDPPAQVDDGEIVDGEEEVDNEPASGETEYVFRIGHSTPPTHPYHLGSVKFGELMAEKTDGRVQVEVFHSSQLGNERDLIEGLQLGTLEMTVVSTAPISSFTDAFLIYDLPFLFTTSEEARGVCDSEFGQNILTSVENEGLKGLTYFENGFRMVTNNTRPIVEPADLEGVKIRTMENPIHMECFSVLGAAPTPMAMSEVYTALQQGTIDGQENPYAIIDTNKFYSVQQYLSQTEHLYSPAPLFMAKDYYDSLPADIQEAVMEAAAEAAVYQREVMDEMNAELIESLQENGFILNEVNKEAFIEATKSVYDKYVGEGAGKIDPAQLEEVRAIIETL